jgi:predicted nucleotidyltransferase
MLKKCLHTLNEKLQQKGILADMHLYGGAVMCLAFNARAGTNDIDAVFIPKMEVYHAAQEVAEELDLSPNWLNDGVKGFLSENDEVTPFESLSNLRIYAASSEYMFAMKALACRTENENEMQDIKFLLSRMNITTLAQAKEIIYKYYPANRILPKTYYALEELLWTEGE